MMQTISRRAFSIWRLEPEIISLVRNESSCSENCIKSSHYIILGNLLRSICISKTISCHGSRFSPGTSKFCIWKSIFSFLFYTYIFSFISRSFDLWTINSERHRVTWEVGGEICIAWSWEDKEPRQWNGTRFVFSHCVAGLSMMICSTDGESMKYLKPN